jgi:hypothetical protein
VRRTKWERGIIISNAFSIFDKEYQEKKSITETRQLNILANPQTRWEAYTSTIRIF